MTTVNNEVDLERALADEVDSVVINDSRVARPMLIAGRAHMGLLPTVVLERLAVDSRCCQMAVGDGIMLAVDRSLAAESLALLESLERRKIELDVEDSRCCKINLYYGKG